MRLVYPIFLLFILFSKGYADNVEYDLFLEEKDVTINNITSRALTINGNIPGPTLRFKEGQTATIRVHNKLKENASIHWHGVLVPPLMDGVPYVSFPPIKPGDTYTYTFPIRQNGTYWYHSHSGYQEQLGVYGAIVIEPKDEAKRFHYDREYVVVLSDWTKEDPKEIVKTLKRGSDWYAIEKGNGQSIVGAIKAKKFLDYLKRDLLRMEPMDISDVAYDYFLINGLPEQKYEAKASETVLLRIINGSAMTYFYVEFSGGPMKVVSADGQDVEPFDTDRLLIAVAETYDIIVKIPDSGSYEFRATAFDSSGFSSLWIGEGEKRLAKDIPNPDLYHLMGEVNLKKIFSLSPTGVMGMDDELVRKGIFDRPGMYHEIMPFMYQEGNMNMHNNRHMQQENNKKEEEINHSYKDHQALSNRYGKKYNKRFGLLDGDIASSKNIAIDGISSERPYPPYDKLKSTKKTLYKTAPVQEIRLTLDGDMKRYIWSLDNKPLSESDIITIKGGHLVRFILINRTMMHHPMHLHGHFFRVINGQGDFSPLKHTVDVAPMSTTVIEFYSHEPGDWFFHCHLLYHMLSGMARIIHYEDFHSDKDLMLIRKFIDEKHNPLMGYGNIALLTNMLNAELKISNHYNIFYFEVETGWKHVKDTESEFIGLWNRYFNRFFTAFLGFDYFKDEEEKIKAFVGIRYLLTGNIRSRLWIDSSGDLRASFEKDFIILPRLKFYILAQYDTLKEWEGKAGLEYIINKCLSIQAQWHSDYQLGVGLKYNF